MSGSIGAGSIAWRRIVLPALLLLMVTLAAAPMARAQLDQMPGPNSPTSKDQVQLYRPPPGKLEGWVSIPDAKAAVLVQPQGREWRLFHNLWERIIFAAAILGMVLLLTAFYVWRGRIRVSSGWSGRKILRFDFLERLVHWTTAVSFVILALTGLVLVFGRPLLIPLIGHDAFTALAGSGKLAHNFLSFPFVLGLVLMLVLWIRDNIPERADLVWLKQGGGMLGGGGEVEHPEAGRFNAGQKMIFWSVILGGAALALSGFALMFPFSVAGVNGMQIVQIVHALIAAVMVAIIIAHIYIGTLGMEGAFDAMATGWVDENWAWEHHRTWVRQQRAETGDGSMHQAAE